MQGNFQKDQTKSKHHWLPQMYLHGFTEHGKIASWQRETGEVRVNAPDNVANARGFYTFKSKDGQKSDELERLFADIERHVKPIIDNINSLFPPPIRGEFKLILAQHIALQHLRTPVNRRELEQTADLSLKLPMWMNLQSREQIILSLKSAGREPTEEAISQLQDFYEDPHSYEVVPSKEIILAAQLRTFPVLTQILLHREWHIVTFDEPALITSDNPVLLKPEQSQPRSWMRGTGFVNAEEIWFPLSSTRLLILARQDYKGPSVVRGGSHIAQVANKVQIASSYMEAFGPPSLIEQYKDKPLGARPLSEIGTGFEKEFFAHYNLPPQRPRPISR